jgi:hypothetical protein
MAQLVSIQEEAISAGQRIGTAEARATCRLCEWGMQVRVFSSSLHPSPTKNLYATTITLERLFSLQQRSFNNLALCNLSTFPRYINMAVIYYLYFLFFSATCFQHAIVCVPQAQSSASQFLSATEALARRIGQRIPTELSLKGMPSEGALSAHIRKLQQQHE